MEEPAIAPADRLAELPDWVYLLREVRELYRRSGAGGSAKIRSHQRGVREAISKTIATNPEVHPQPIEDKPVTAYIRRAMDNGRAEGTWPLIRALDAVLPQLSWLYGYDKVPRGLSKKYAYAEIAGPGAGVADLQSARDHAPDYRVGPGTGAVALRLAWDAGEAGEPEDGLHAKDQATAERLNRMRWLLDRAILAMSRLSRTPKLAEAWEAERDALHTGSAWLHIVGLCVFALHFALTFPDLFFMALGFAFAVLVLLHGITCMATDAFHARHPKASDLRGDGPYGAYIETAAPTDNLAFVMVWARRRLTRVFWELALVLGALALLQHLAT